jgi:hypothetical protein
MKKARWILPLLAALFLVPCAGAAERVVASDGTVFTVDVMPVGGGASPDATALSFSILHPGGTTESGMVPPTEDALGDREPALVLSPGSGGPFLVWTRNDGLHDQIAFARLAGNAWGGMKYLTSGGRDHTRPQAGVDSHGIATVAWVESGGGGRVMVGIVDPGTGNLLASPRDLLRETGRGSPAHWLGSQSGTKVLQAPASADIWPTPDGGNDTPAIPPCSNGVTLNCRSYSSGVVASNSVCPRVATAVVRNNVVTIGLMEGGVIVATYQSVIPLGAPADYVTMLTRTILNENCGE